jgi:peptidoglycan/xylan/chitin deacetylase (PgdA/CDA1 family)
LAKKLHDAGHTLCNHTYSHPHLPKLGRAEQAEEIDRGTEAVMKITGVAPCWFRFPYLDYTDDLVELVETRGMHSVGCSMYTRDPDLESTGQQIVDRLRASFREDGIVVGHHWSRATRQALAVLVPEWRATVGVGALALPGE